VRSAKQRVLAALAGVAAVLPSAVAFWNFTVDDALIIARYSHNIWTGAGYRFNVGGPVSDGVTPLGWAYLLAPWSASGALGAFWAAKWFGLCSWLAGAAALGIAIAEAGRHHFKYAALLLLACSAPLAAWSVAGMETGFVLGLASLAAAARACGRDRLVALCAGLVAGWRPEALPWALVLAIGPSRVAPSTHVSKQDRRFAKMKLALLAATPFALITLIRWLVFDNPLPLALTAKPSNWAHGWRYALACFLLTGPVAALAWRRLEPWCRGLQVAVAVHFSAIAIAGGDWMPLSRLVVVALPCVVLAAAHIGGTQRSIAFWPRIVLAIAGQLFVIVRAGPAAAAVGPQRLALIDRFAPELRRARAVAALDAGWVGVATRSPVVDLAGVTDRAIASLPGGHTSKWVAAHLLIAREVDTVVLLLAKGEPLGQPWWNSRFARIVEHRLALMPLLRESFEVVAVNPSRTLGYVLLRSKERRPSHRPRLARQRNP